MPNSDQHRPWLADDYAWNWDIGRILSNAGHSWSIWESRPVVDPESTNIGPISTKLGPTPSKFAQPARIRPTLARFWTKLGNPRRLNDHCLATLIGQRSVFLRGAWRIARAVGFDRIWFGFDHIWVGFEQHWSGFDQARVGWNKYGSVLANCFGQPWVVGFGLGIRPIGGFEPGGLGLILASFGRTSTTFGPIST